jgi:hypothetical protein
MSIIKTDTGIKITKSSGGRKKGAKRSKANKPSRVKYRATGRMFKNHESKLKALARKLQRRIDRGATPPRKVENLKGHIGDLLEAAKRWSDKRFR